MMRSKRILPLILAVVLQVMPMLRAVLPVSTQAYAPSAWAIVLKLAGGAVALLGSYHAVSGATGILAPYTVTTAVGAPYIRKLFTSVQVAISWSASTAPLQTPVYPLTPGLWLTNATGFIGGVPTQVTTSNIIISAWEFASNSGAVVSTNFTFTITNSTAPPTITGPPTNQLVSLGANALFSVTAIGAIPFSYIWQFNGTNIFNGTNSTLQVANVQASDAGLYTVIVANQYGRATNAASLTINTDPPTIVNSLTNQNVLKGATVTFSVTVTGATPLSYQWLLDGVAVSGGTNATLSLPNVQTTNAGTYIVLVSNPYGSASNSVTLTVNLRPVISPLLTSQSVPLGADFTFSVSATGTPPLSYLWRFNGAFIPGATNTTLPVFNVQFTNTGNYQVIVTNLWGVAASSAKLTVDGPPAIVQSPASQTVAAGTPLTLSVNAIGTALLRYQWQQNQASLAGATNAILAIPSFQSTNEGSYRVVVSNDFGVATSPDARFMVDSPPRFGLVQWLPGGAFQLEFVTMANTNCTIQASTNLVDWQPLVTTNSPNGLIDFMDQAATNWPNRFYRGAE